MSIRVSKNRARRGRPPKHEAITRWSVSIPSSIAAPWDLITLNPQTGQARLGLRQFVVGELLRLTLQAWQRGETSISIPHVMQRISEEVQYTSTEDAD
jgi:hypothetical protein